MDKNQIFEKLKNGEIKIYQIEDFVTPQEAIDIRREYIEHITKYGFDHIDKYNFDPSTIYKRNCENVIGGVSVPVGVVGPIDIKSQTKSGEYYVPLATTEGALVASVNRGAKVCTLAGGIQTYSKYIGITRAMLFRTDGIEAAKAFERWFAKNIHEIKRVAQKTSNHLKILDYKFFGIGNQVWIRFNFDTQDAMGMNMASIACQAIVNHIDEDTSVDFSRPKLVAISGNMCTDKKPAWINSIEGRGRIVEAEIKIPAEIVQKYFRADIVDIVEVHKSKTLLGSAMAGSIGFNAHAANMIAGIFLATGQDIAQVVEGSQTVVDMQCQNNLLYVAIKIPALNIATVGGGTRLEAQRELIDFATLSSDKKTDLLAELIAATVLAGELSLHAALASGDFVSAHEKLGHRQ